MKILFLTAHLPFPPASGGRRREFELVSRLGRKFEVCLCSLSTDLQSDTENAKGLQGHCQSINLFRAYEIPQNQLGGTYPWLMRRYYCDQAVNRITEMVAQQKFDIVHVEGYYLMQLVPFISNSDPRILLVEHNMEYKLSLQRLILSSSVQEAYLYWQDYYQTLYWERNYWKRATKTITLTSEDSICVRRLEPQVDVSLIPNGIDHDFVIENAYAPNLSNDSRLLDCSTSGVMINDDTPSILFVGNFLYYPNIDAILYFCKRIFPLILKEISDAKLLIVGNSPPPEIHALQVQNRDNVVVTGYVPSLYQYYKSAKVVVCPLRIGGGIKVKILEALRAGKAIVSTSVGAQGLNLSNQLLCISDSCSDFANNVIRLLYNPEERHELELGGVQFVNSMPKWDEVKEAYVRCYTEMSSNKKLEN